MNEISVTPLGTVSPYCKGEKNCPGFLIEYNGNKILLDCGEGISSLLKLPDDLNNLIIILSHLHKDHYSGLSSIGYASYVYKNLGYLNKKIKVYIPDGDFNNNRETLYYDDGWGGKVRVDKKISDFEYLIDYGDENYLEFEVYENFQYPRIENIKLDDMLITFSKNPHNIKTYSIKLETDDLKIVYSGDTGYEGNRLKAFAKDADLLICESTFLKGQKRENDSHLYAYEAAMIARDANVEKLLLTHFWPEIDKNLYVEEAKKIFNNVEAAEEGQKLVLRRKYE